MTIPTLACSTVVVGALVLFGFSHPTDAASLSPTTPSPAASVVSGSITLRSLSVDLPDSERAFPPGPGVEVAQANCAACHSVGMVMNQPALSHATWETEVRKMVAVYKAPVSDEDAKTIVAYLDRIKGADSIKGAR